MTRQKEFQLDGFEKTLKNGWKERGFIMMTELELIRATIPVQYKRVRESIIEYKRSKSNRTLKRKEEYLKELFRLIEEELNLSCRFNSKTQQDSID